MLLLYQLVRNQEQLIISLLRQNEIKKAVKKKLIIKKKYLSLCVSRTECVLSESENENKNSEVNTHLSDQRECSSRQCD